MAITKCSNNILSNILMVIDLRSTLIKLFRHHFNSRIDEKKQKPI